MRTKTILLIDDEVDFSRLLRLNIEDTKEYKALTANDWKTALELVEQHHPDLILLDMMMPGMTGLELLGRIKKLKPEIPVAMVTAVWNEQEAKRAFDAGAYEYITKPVDFEYLRTALLVKLL
jgi:CheY-like chemotaxis protein